MYSSELRVIGGSIVNSDPEHVLSVVARLWNGKG